jgi:flagellar hook-associated protein 1 FlgK
MSLITSFNTAVTGLRVASQGIGVTSHNVANATTEGYSQRSLRVQTGIPSFQSGLGIGTGATPTGVSRTADILVNERLMTAVGDESRSAARYQTLAVVEASYDESSGVGPASLMGAFFDSMGRLTLDPSDPTLRADVLNTADRFTGAVNQLAIDLASSKQDIFEEVRQSLPLINEKLSQVARYNAAVTGASSELGAGDFQDQRDQVIMELAQEFGFTAEFTGDGAAQISLGGHAVVSGSVARELTLSQTTTGDPQINLSADSATIDVTNSVGGYFGGRVDANTDINGFEAELNTFIDTLGSALNTQHAAGFDQTGAPGGAMFSFTAGSEAITFSLDATLAADAQLLAAAGAATAAAGDGTNLASLVDIEAQLLFAAGTQTAPVALGGIYASVGRAVANADLKNQTGLATLDDLVALRDAVSGVDLDEEAADLLGWQASYQAASRVVTTTNQMLGELMEMVR